ncbi:bactofilin family protein [Paenibacillus lignilyticus]|uniref:Polymer-forming cytoskeletal protein n=1 Tax=Paenibacillus lignilyticus TaxID=1172615 RepID=A0ABS5CKA0_9BACL|nr:polymer-forming cytoskeletal protein [Paenibacillus lignilyticus]MBP3966302.1 polymer-forming cytoskeletal protein [Paenibacillus lignilyticus]
MFNWKRDKISAKLTDTFIGEGTIVEGTIRSAGGVRLEGQLRGDISCDGDVVVGESGFAISNITARNVILAGQVTGNVHITGKLTISATGKLYGDLTAATLTIEDGGLFQGKSTMDHDEPAVNPVDRRSGIERRSGNSGNYTGVERRSGYDRRDMVVGEDGAVVWAAPKKISYRAIDKTSETDETAGNDNSGIDGKLGEDRAAASHDSMNRDPLRESGKAFISSISGGSKPTNAADDTPLADRDAGRGEDRTNRDAQKDKEVFNQVISRINQGVNEAERAALSGVILPEAVKVAITQSQSEIAAGSEFVTEHSELMDEDSVSAVDLVLDAGSFVSDSVGAVEEVQVDQVSAGSFEAISVNTAMETASEKVSVESFEADRVSTESSEMDKASTKSFEADDVSGDLSDRVIGDVNVEGAQVGVEEAVAQAEAAANVDEGSAAQPSVVADSPAKENAAIAAATSDVPAAAAMNVKNSSEPVKPSDNVYSYGFEDRANGNASTNEPAQRSAEEAAALLKNW